MTDDDVDSTIKWLSFSLFCRKKMCKITLQLPLRTENKSFWFSLGAKFQFYIFLQEAWELLQNMLLVTCIQISIVSLPDVISSPSKYVECNKHKEIKMCFVWAVILFGYVEYWNVLSVKLVLCINFYCSFVVQFMLGWFYSAIQRTFSVSVYVSVCSKEGNEI